ncbi:MAG: hypothetical protein JWM68_3014 [Verrucomicrobiales bacterium]|nr:hypothetical protein [Verrucomicrobiales bacterium]
MILGAFVAIVLCGLLALFIPASSSSGKCTIGFSHFTNDTSGLRVAVFDITNTHERRIGFMRCARIRTPTGWPGPDFGGQPPLFGDRWWVPPHSSITFSVAPPTNNVTWRVDAFYKLEPPLRGKVLYGLFRLLDGCGIRLSMPESLYPRDWEHTVGPELGLSSPP